MYESPISFQAQNISTERGFFSLSFYVDGELLARQGAYSPHPGEGAPRLSEARPRHRSRLSAYCWRFPPLCGMPSPNHSKRTTQFRAGIDAQLFHHSERQLKQSDTLNGMNVQSGGEQNILGVKCPQGLEVLFGTDFRFVGFRFLSQKNDMEIDTFGCAQRSPCPCKSEGLLQPPLLRSSRATKQTS